MKNEKGLSLIGLLVIIVLAIFALNVMFSESSNNVINSQSKSYGLGDTITFNDLELTFDTSYSFDVVASTIKLKDKIKMQKFSAFLFYLLIIHLEIRIYSSNFIHFTNIQYLIFKLERIL
jgi:hypothetical protein